MLQLLRDIKTLVTGPPSDIPRKIPYESTPDWEKERVSLTLDQLERRLHALERIKQELQTR